jgi:hypothetical protein
MIWKISLLLSCFVIASQMTLAQNSSGNLLTGDVKAQVITRYGGPAPLPKPDEIVIHDFAVGNIKTDESIAARLHRTVMDRHGVDEDSSPEVLAQRLQAAFTKALAGELKKVNIQTTNAPKDKVAVAEGSMPGSHLVVDGEFVAINEGDETKRIMIGCGRGASSVKTYVKVSSVTQGRSTVVLEFNLSSESGKKPGAVATMGVGSLAVGAAAGGVSDRKSNVEADASRMAKLVAKQLESFMADQKWIANPSATAASGAAQVNPNRQEQSDECPLERKPEAKSEKLQPLMNSASMVMCTVSPTRIPPVSSAVFQVRPKSLRSILVVASRPMRGINN